MDPPCLLRTERDLSVSSLTRETTYFMVNIGICIRKCNAYKTNLIGDNFAHCIGVLLTNIFAAKNSVS